MAPRNRGSQAAIWSAGSRLLLPAAVGAAYLIGARLGLQLALANRNVTAVWPPTGIAVASLLLFGVRALPGVAIGAFLANLTNGAGLEASALITVGNTLAPLAASLLLTRVLAVRHDLSRVRDVAALMMGGLAAMTISATLGTVALLISGGLSPGAYGTTWTTWWIGDSMGVVLFGPVLLLVATTRSVPRPTRANGLEAGVLLLVLVGASAGAFVSNFPLTYLIFPPIIWAALRFSRLGAAVAVVIASSIAIAATVRGGGPYEVSLSVTGSLVAIQALNGCVALVALVLAAVTDQARAARNALEHLTADLVAQHEHDRFEGDRLSELASTDSLTGLRNRREFDRALRNIPRHPFAILSVDVDGLKEANDAHGHAAGDALLRAVGHTLGLLVRGWDVMARVGGDEFAAFLPDLGAFGAKQVADRMRVAMHSLELPSGPVRISVGWSAAVAGADPLWVWQKADESLYNAKRAGGDRVMGGSFQGSEAGDIAERSYTDVVGQILDGGRIITMFQPIINLSDGSVTGYEALARPDGFAATDSVEAVFEAARTTGQIRDLDWICRRRAVEDAEQLPAGIALFLNVSASVLLDPVHSVDQLLLLLRASGRTPDTVVLEITEHERVGDYEVLGRVLASYRAEGIRFALDDVGEGHSTLELLAASSSEFLKLGRRLTMTSTQSGSRASIEATTAFARATGATVIAEGVENEFVADLMKGAGIWHGQGFGLGKPTIVADLEDVRAALAGRAALSVLRPRSAQLRTRT